MEVWYGGIPREDICLLALNSVYSNTMKKKKGAKPGVIEPGTSAPCATRKIEKTLRTDRRTRTDVVDVLY